MYLERDAAAEWREWESRIKFLTDSVATVKGITPSTHIPPIANHVPHLKLTWDKPALNLSVEDVRQQLREGNPSIEITPSTPSTPEVMTIGVWMLQPGEDRIVARRLREIFKAA